MSSPKTVLVPLDGTVHATSAVPVAHALAELFHATLTVLHVSDRALASTALLDRMKLTSQDVRGMVVDQRLGAAAVNIIEEAADRHTALIVMCPQTRTDGSTRTFGSVAEAVLRAAPCPVVFVPPSRGRGDWALRQVLLPHDGTPTSAATIGPATELASTAAAHLVVLHVATAGTQPPSEPGTLISPRYVDQPQHEWPTWGQEFLDRLRAIGGVTDRLDIQLALAQGEAGTAILDFARKNDSDLIVLGWRGALEADRARTMRRVIHNATCPVIVFRVDRG